MIIFHDPRCVQYDRFGHVERPERISATAPLLRERHPNWEWREPAPADEIALRRVHSAEHLASIRDARADFDADCPVYPQLFEHAARAAGAAIDGARASLRGEQSFSLMRPPGHHATRSRVMGFCYFSNIAIAAFDALENGANRIAIFDFDAHHGNGTEEMVTNHPRITFASVHQFPGWPGTGTVSAGNIRNFPVAPMIGRATHMFAIEQALEWLLFSKPDLLLVSAGFDAYAGDPITQMRLEAEDFATCGRWLGESGVPAAAILEGGYSEQLPELIDAFLREWSSE
ncbi:MAG: histone deacetylase family protein [Chthoniobacterales bacterium]